MNLIGVFLFCAANMFNSNDWYGQELMSAAKSLRSSHKLLVWTNSYSQQVDWGRPAIGVTIYIATQPLED